MQFEIQRVPADIDPEEFERSFYRTRTPVVVTGVARDWRATQTWDPETLRADIIEEGESKVIRWYWDVTSDFRKGDYQTPAILSHLQRTCELRFSERPMRVWIAGRKTRTAWHYDFRSLDSLNVQVKGRKRFALLSPETPLRCYAFDSIVLRRMYAGTRVLDAHHDYTIFDLAAGDMLFVPRYWFHTVESQDDVNINLNWVWTDLDTAAAPSRTATRERECVAVRLWVRRAIDRLRRRQIPRGLAEYGNSEGIEVPERFYRETPSHRMLLRAALELAVFPPGRIERRRQRRIELELHGGVTRTRDDYFKRSEQTGGTPTAP